MTAAAAEDSGRVGPYRVIQAIGAGGSARIDLARIDRAYGFQRHVVLKRPLEHLRGDPQVAASLRREARIGGQLRHPNLVAILDAGVHDGYDYLVLEYVHGAALRTVMQADAPSAVRELPLGVALAIVSDAARGMHEAHELTDGHGSPLGLVHRDVSPGNILLGLDGTVKLADFGIAKETRVSTLSGSMHGTVTYMAPEQCQGHAFDRRADVFSLGVILYELVTGRRLFWAENDVASLHRVLSGTVPRPRALRPQIPGALEDIVLTAVAHDAQRRFATALELATALEHYAATAGEVLGARWIARSVEAVVGARPVPWIAAPVREITPSGSHSLVDLIAAAGPDEPVEPSFGLLASDADQPGADGVAEAAVAAPPHVSARAPSGAAGRARRPWRSSIAGRVALGGVLALGVGIAAAIATTHGDEAPAAVTASPSPPAAPARDVAPAAAPAAIHATTTEANPEASTEASHKPTAEPAGETPPPASQTPPPAGQTPPPTPAADPATRNAPATRDAERDTAAPSADPSRTRAAATRPPPTERPAFKHRVRSAPRPAHPAAEATVVERPAEHADAAATPPGAGGSPPGTGGSPPGAGGSPPGTGGSPPPPRPPPPKVEWKPTLLLPTDGSGGRDRK